MYDDGVAIGCHSMMGFHSQLVCHILTDGLTDGCQHCKGVILVGKLFVNEIAIGEVV